MSKVLKPIGVTNMTTRMILLYLSTIKRPARTSEIRAAVVQHSPESANALYGCLQELQAVGMVKRLTFERDALMTSGE